MTKPKQIKKTEFSYFVEIDIRWADMDSLGHVNNANFLTYVETARVKLLEKLGFKDVPIIMASIKIDYINQLSYPQKIEIGQKVVRIGYSSFDILTAIFEKKNGTIITVSTTTLVCFDYKKQTKIQIPQEIIKYYEDDFL